MPGAEALGRALSAAPALTALDAGGNPRLGDDGEQEGGRASLMREQYSQQVVKKEPIAVRLSLFACAACT